MKKYTVNEIKNVHSISVLMFGLLGDVLIRTPVLKALKSIYPDAKIIAIVDPIGKIVLQHNPYCDEIIVADRAKSNKLKYIINKVKLLFHLRSKHSQMIVDLYNGGSSYGMVILSNSKYRLGYCYSKKKEIYNVVCDEAYKNNVSFYESCLSVIKPLSKKQFDLKPIFKISEKSLLNMKKYSESININLEKTYILNFGSGGVEKIMNFEKYFYLVKYIYITYGYTPAIVSNPGQEYLQENFINDFLLSSNIEYKKLKTLTLDEIGCMVSMTKFIITPDTGLMHLAMSLNNYIFAIFTYTNPSLVDIKNEKFIAVYEDFATGVLYQEQTIETILLVKKINGLFQKMKRESCES